MANVSTNTSSTSPAGESFAALFEESLARQEMRSGEVITAEVVSIDDDFVIVNAGLKSESIIPTSEFLNDRGELEISVGDFVKVCIESLEDGYGSTKLSREKAKRLAAWLDLEEAMNEARIIKGMINGRVKGGLTVMVNGIRAFLPGSLVDLRPVKDTTPFENKEWDFKVIKLDRKRNNVVVSRRAVLEENMGADREALLGSLKEGAVVKGIVKNITDYGAFVDLGGIDGLLHITDLAWRRVKHPSEVLTVGEEVEAKILKFDQEKNRVSLGLKQLGERGARLSGVNGGIELRLANGLNADLTARGMNGNVRSEIAEVTVDKDDHGSRYSARIGTGGAPITLSGINGNVRLTRAENQAATTTTTSEKKATTPQKEVKATESKSARDAVQ